MKPNVAVNRAATVVATVTLFFSCALLLAGQTNKKPAPAPAQSSAPAKAAPVKPAPAATAQQHAAQNQQHPGQPLQRPGQPVQNSANRATTPGRNATTSRAAALGGTQPGPHTVARNTVPATKASNVASAKPLVPAAGVARTSPGPNGSVRGYNNKGALTHVTTRSGAEARIGQGGRVTTIRTANGTTITHVRTGPRVVAGDHLSPGGVRYHVVNTGPGRGYVAHSFSRGSRVYERRTYVVGGRTYVSVYRGYGYRGRVYYGYVPAYYYHPGYYGWAYAPWGPPVAYAWGWGASPWYAAYGYYWTPSPVYPSAALWLTDYVVAQNLQAAYEARAAAPTEDTAAQEPGDQSQPPPSEAMSAQTKQWIADEVRAQLIADQAAAAQSNDASPQRGSTPPPNVDQAPPALDPTLKVFIVSTSLDVTAEGQSCALSAGDILMRIEDAPGDDDMVGVKVVSSQRADCAGGSAQRVQVSDLQEMHNHFREQMDGGLKLLAERQGKNGLPAAPAGSGRNNPEGVAAEDLNVNADLKKQQDEADQAEKDVQQASSPAASSGNN